MQKVVNYKKKYVPKLSDSFQFRERVGMMANYLEFGIQVGPYSYDFGLIDYYTLMNNMPLSMFRRRLLSEDPINTEDLQNQGACIRFCIDHDEFSKKLSEEQLFMNVSKYLAENTDCSTEFYDEICEKLNEEGIPLTVGTISDAIVRELDGLSLLPLKAGVTEENTKPKMLTRESSLYFERMHKAAK